MFVGKAKGVCHQRSCGAIWLRGSFKTGPENSSEVKMCLLFLLNITLIYVTLITSLFLPGKQLERDNHICFTLVACKQNKGSEFPSMPFTPGSCLLVFFYCKILWVFVKLFSISPSVVPRVHGFLGQWTVARWDSGSMEKIFIFYWLFLWQPLGWVIRMPGFLQ